MRKKNIHSVRKVRVEEKWKKIQGSKPRESEALRTDSLNLEARDPKEGAQDRGALKEVVLKEGPLKVRPLKEGPHKEKHLVEELLKEEPPKEEAPKQKLTLGCKDSLTYLQRKTLDPLRNSENFYQKKLR